MCVLCEYDALPEIGHACGHNLIAEAGLAAGLGVKAYLETQKPGSGTITVMGTPAEEGGGGKVYLLEKDGFKDIDVAIMVHPAPEEAPLSTSNARSTVAVEYTGKAAHAAAFPWEGVNALDAAIQAYAAISTLRQQFKPDWRVHGIITNGGTKPNIIPEKSSLLYYIRAPTYSEMLTLKEKVFNCFHAAAKATGCAVKIETVEKDYLNLISNPIIGKLYATNLESIGVKYDEYEKQMQWSTDMGNVSHAVPSLHPIFAVGSGEINHTREFTDVCGTADAHDKTLNAAKAMATALIDVLVGGEDMMRDIVAAHKKLTT